MCNIYANTGCKRQHLSRAHMLYLMSSWASRIFHSVLLPYIIYIILYIYYIIYISLYIYIIYIFPHRSKILTAWVTQSPFPTFLMAKGILGSVLNDRGNVYHQKTFFYIFSCKRAICHEYLLTNFFNVKGDGFTFVLLVFFLDGARSDGTLVGETKQHETTTVHKCFRRIHPDPNRNCETVPFSCLYTFKILTLSVSQFMFWALKILLQERMNKLLLCSKELLPQLPILSDSGS